MTTTSSSSSSSAQHPTAAGAWIRTHRGEAYGLGGAAVLVAAFLLRKAGKSSSAAAGSPASAYYPVQPMTADTTGTDLYNSLEPQLENLQGQITALSGGGGGGSPSAGTPPPASGPEPPALALGFTNPNTPVAWINGQLIDTGTGRLAWYGPGGQPGGPIAPGAPVPAGDAEWMSPGGEVVYDPGNFRYADPNRPPVPQFTPAGSSTSSPAPAAGINPGGLMQPAPRPPLRPLPGIFSPVPGVLQPR